MKLFTRYKLHHALAWVTYFVFWVWLSMRLYHTPFPYALLATLIWFIGQAAVIYSCIYWLIPRFLLPRHYGLFTLWLLALLLASSLWIALVAGALFRNALQGFTLSYGEFFFYVLLNNFFLAGLAVAMGLIRERIRSGRHQRRLEQERTENELRFLKSQVNPHFLFNAINSIYVLIKKDPAVAAATLAQFADMLRYQLYECNVDQVSIEKELTYIDNYVQLEKLRRGESTDIAFTADEGVRHFSIAPLLLAPFVENAFKHVATAAGGRPRIGIGMQYADGVFSLAVENTADLAAKPSGSNGYGGIGLENVRRRLQLIYPHRHSLQITTENNVYSIALSIKITG